MPSSPTFIARFVDGEVVRMTTYHDDKRKTLDLDLERGVRLARWAYLSRKRQDRSRKKQGPVLMTEASFECLGETLATYTAEQLAEVKDATQ